MNKRSFAPQRTNGTAHSALSRSRDNFLDIVPIAKLGSSERRRVDAIVEAVAPGSTTIGASIPGRTWDIRPIVVAKSSSQKSQSLIRLFGPEVTLSVNLTERIGQSLEQLSKSGARSALYIEHGIFDGQYWLRRAVVPETLAERLSHGAQLSFAEALRIGRGLVETVTKLHSHGVIHGHISASNVYTSPSGEVGLIDPLFGVAVIQASQLLEMKEITAGYDLGTFAPECQSTEWPGFDADVFGIGKVFWSLFSKVHRGENSSNLAEMSSSQLRAIREIILGMNDQEPNRRLTFEDVIERFDEFASDHDSDPVEIDLREIEPSAEEAELDSVGTANFSRTFLDKHVRDDLATDRAASDDTDTHADHGSFDSQRKNQAGKFATRPRILRTGGTGISAKPVAPASEELPATSNVSPLISSGISSTISSGAVARKNIPGREAISEVFFSAESEEEELFPIQFQASEANEQQYEDLSDEFDPKYDYEKSDHERGLLHRSNRSNGSRKGSRVSANGDNAHKEIELSADTVDDLAEEIDSSSIDERTRQSRAFHDESSSEESLFDDRVELPEIDEFDFVDHIPASNIADQRESRREPARKMKVNPRSSGEFVAAREQEIRFAPKPRRPKQSEKSSRPRRRTETLTNLIAQIQLQQTKRWAIPAGVVAMGILAAYIALRDPAPAQSSFSGSELRSAWSSGIASRMATVAEAAVSGGAESRAAEEIIVSSVLGSDKNADVLGGGARLLRIAFDKRWEMALSDVDRRQAIRLASAKLLGEKALKLEAPSLDSLHPGVLLALIATAQNSATVALNTIPAANLRALPPPIGPAFAELSKNSPDLRCGDDSVRALSRFAVSSTFEPQEVQKFLMNDLAARLRSLAVITSHDQNAAAQILGILLSHPNIKFTGDLFTWADVSRLTEWERFDAADQLFVLAGIAPSKEPSLEHVRWMRGHPSPELRQYALEQTLDRVKLNHPAGLEILTALKSKPAALSAIQTYDLSLVLETPKSVTADQAKKWLKSDLPDTVLEKMVVAASSENSPTVVDMEAVAFLEQKGWNPPVETLQKLSQSPQKYFRLLAVSKIYRLQNSGLARQLISATLEREQDPELKTQLQSMLQILAAN